jgi:hypothetical protein
VPQGRGPEGDLPARGRPPEMNWAGRRVQPAGVHWRGNSAALSDVLALGRPQEVPMPIDLEKLGEELAALFIGSSTLLLTAAIAWR